MLVFMSYLRGILTGANLGESSGSGAPILIRIGSRARRLVVWLSQWLRGLVNR